MKDWKSGQMIAIKAHSFRNERPLEDAILLIRNPYDAILAEYNRYVPTTWFLNESQV